jgi:hypothetical protein
MARLLAAARRNMDPDHPRDLE